MKTDTPFDKWYEIRSENLVKIFGLLAEDTLKEYMFKAFEFGATHKKD